MCIREACSYSIAGEQERYVELVSYFLFPYPSLTFAPEIPSHIQRRLSVIA